MRDYKKRSPGSPSTFSAGHSMAEYPEQQTSRSPGTQPFGHSAGLPQSRNSSAGPPAGIFQLQRTVGNQAVQRLLQAKSDKEPGPIMRPISNPQANSGERTAVPSQPSGEAPIQRQLWKAELRGRKPKTLMVKAYDRWLGPPDSKPAGFITMEEAFGYFVLKPKRELENGEIFDDETGEITTVAEQNQTRAASRQKTAKKKMTEAKRRKDLTTGQGFKSSRLKTNAENEYKKKRALEEAQEDTGLYHMGGDTDTEEFEGEGLHQTIIDRVDNLHITQTDLMNDASGKEQLAWFKLNEAHREQIEAARQSALSNRDEIYHSPGERPMYTASLLEAATPQKRPALKEDTTHTGIGGPIDDLSHSIPWAQVPEHLRNANEGGVNHPKNIPYENFVTNQVVNTAVERVAQSYLDQKKQVVKVVCRLWKDDHVDRTVHVYFVQDLAYPLVFATRNLGDKKPKRYKRGVEL